MQGSLSKGRPVFVPNRNSYFLNRISNVHIHSQMLNFIHAKELCRKNVRRSKEEWKITVRAV